MKCACKEPNCPKQIHLDTESGLLYVDSYRTADDSYVPSSGVYLDPNLATEIIKSLRQYLLRQTEKIDV